MASFPLLISAKRRHSPTFIPSFFDSPFFLDILFSYMHDCGKNFAF